MAALLRGVTPNLTWRDIKLILAASARKNDASNPGWQTGARKYGAPSAADRYHFNHEYGFGVVDAGAAVDLARGWTNVPSLVSASAANASGITIPSPSGRTPRTVTTTLTLDTVIRFIEFVEVNADFDHPSFRDVEIELVSPSGNVSQLVDPFDTRYHTEDGIDENNSFYVPLRQEFRLGSARHLGEDPNGRWTLRLTDHFPGHDGTLRSWSIRVYGHASGAAGAFPDREILEILYHATGGPGWANNTNWLSDGPLEEWNGVTTDVNGRVTGLYLYGNRLSGSIPSELGSLTNLGTLRLDNNRLSGPIPTELGGLTNLGILDLGDNRLSGPVPAELGGLTNLTTLSLYRNQLSGEVPPELGILANLTWLDLQGNPGLSGPLPGSFTGLSSLRSLWLEGTQLCLPGNAEVQEWLRGVGNKSGVVNCDAADRAALVALYNATDGPNWADNANWLTDGPLEDWTGVTTDASGRVLGLDLAGNQLSGPIPLELGDLANLEWLCLGYNQLTGQIPPTLGSIPNLQDLSLDDNQLSGSVPTSLGNLSNLRGLYLQGNQLSGSVPISLGNLSNLRGLYLQGNQLTGPIPSSLGSLTNLYELFLGGNMLTGEIPSSLGNLANLQWLYLSSNQLTGSIPSQLGNLANLQWLYLGYNQLTGQIPSSLGNLANLQGLYLYGNELTGQIPSLLGNLANLGELFLDGNQLTGCIPGGNRGRGDQ